MGGILDIFDSPDLLSQLFGVSSAQAKPAPTPTPLPPFQGSAEPPLQGGALGSPTPVQTASYGPSGQGAAPPPLPPAQDFGPNMSFDQRAAPVQADIANGVVDPQGGNYTDFSRNPNQPNPPAAGGGTVPPMAPPGNVAGPATIPRPPNMPPAPNGGPVQVAGPPMYPGSAAPPPPPGVMNQNGAPPVTNTSGSLASSMGLNQNALQAGFAGLGKGLSAVGAQRPGATAGASFAAGAGGAITGSNQQIEQNQAQARQAQNDAFNQKSTAFKDWMANNLDESRAKYFDAFAAQKKSGAAGSNAWQNTPYGKAQNLEKMLDSWETQQRLQLAAKWKAKGSTPEEVQTDLDNLQKQKETERTRRSNALGISPDEHLSGTSSDKPFDFNKLTPQQRLDVPDGAYYKYKDPNDPKADKDGNVIKQRDWLSTPPYEGWEPSSPAGGAPPQQAQLPNPQQAEYQAMQ